MAGTVVGGTVVVVLVVVVLVVGVAAVVGGEGTGEPGWVLARVLAKKRDAKAVLAAPDPLVLEEVAYPADDEMLARAELTRAVRKH